MVENKVKLEKYFGYFRCPVCDKKLQFKNQKVLNCVGKKQANNVIDKFPQFADKIVITGNPRVDLWRHELREYFQDKVAEIRAAYGPYILIASNFASVNYFHKLDFVLNQRKREGMVRSFEDEEYLRRRYNYKLKLFKKFLELIAVLNKTFPKHKIIIRPHPAEKHDLWEKTAEGLSNVEVIYEDSVTPWILGADALIHDSCTTGIEAYLLDVPVFSYRPYTSQEFDSYLPLAVSHKAFDADSLVKSLKEVLRKKNSNLSEDSKDLSTILTEHIAALDGIFADERIINSLAKIDIKKQTLYGGKGEASLTKPKVKRFIKEIIKGVFLSIPESIRPFFLRERLNAWKNQRKKFPPTDINEIRKDIDKFSAILNRFKKVQVHPICKNCFYIINNA